MLKSMKTPIGRKATLLWINLAIVQRSVGKILIIKSGRCEAAKQTISENVGGNTKEKSSKSDQKRL